MLSGPAFALNATFSVAPNGTQYQAVIDLEATDKYSFYDIGVLGERIPAQVTGVILLQENQSVSFNRTEASTIVFPKGNYSLVYTGSLRDNHLQQSLPQPYMVTVELPQGLDVRNPLIGMISPQGGRITALPGNRTAVTWEKSKNIEIRFYDPGRETLLYLFGNFWVVIAVVMLLPFLMTYRRGRKRS